MSAVPEIHASPRDVVLDIEAELKYWRQCYRKRPFHQRGLPFEAYVPTLKFGYDAYLLHHREALELLMPALKERYLHHLPCEQRLEWSRSQRIIRETWQRIQPCASANKLELASLARPAVHKAPAHESVATGP
jgi:hypothetical protein